MKRYTAWAVLAGALAGLGQTGCTSMTLLSPSDPVPPMEDTAAASPVKELPSDATAKLCLTTAESLEKAGKIGEATALYEKARQADPRLKQVSRRLAVLYDRQGNFPRAQEEYDLALKQSPNDPSLLNDLGYSYYCRGQWEEAEKHLRKALEKNPKHERAWNNLALTLGQQGHYIESLEAFTKVVGPSRAQCNLGFILTTQGRREEAKTAYREALRLDPELILAQGALAKLEGREVVAAAPKSSEKPSRREREKARKALEDKYGADEERARETVDTSPIIVDPAAGQSVDAVPTGAVPAASRAADDTPANASATAPVQPVAAEQRPTVAETTFPAPAAEAPARLPLPVPEQ